ncbi:MAG: molybdopterin dehydrogenase, FAD-binding protein [Streptosporangiaceae bacterium]|nr:molybdopterin dehydrogenase, FAD-binding protein [Streptosporangiaceae bacterium]
MKPAAFDYLAPSTVGEAVDALADTGRRAQVLAGGQSLLLDLHYRRSHPDLVLDINRVHDLDHLGVHDGALHVGALVRHRVFESPQVAPGPLGRLLSLAVVNIAHPPIRALGTMVGSLAYAHPAAEWCTTALALDAEIEMHGPDGVRVVGARDYFHGPHRTARGSQELITAVRLPLLGDTTGVGFAEHRRTHASFAQIAVVVTLTAPAGVITGARVGLANAADRPIRAYAAERSLIGTEAGRPLPSLSEPHPSEPHPSERGSSENHPFDWAGRIAAERDADPRAQPYADVDYQRQVIAVLVSRALRQASADRRAHAGHDGAGGPR